MLHEENAVICLNKAHLLFEVLSPERAFVAPGSTVHLSTPWVSDLVKFLVVFSVFLQNVRRQNRVSVPANQIVPADVARSCDDVVLLVLLSDLLEDFIVSHHSSFEVTIASHAERLPWHVSEHSEGLERHSSLNVSVVYIEFGIALLQNGSPPSVVL